MPVLLNSFCFNYGWCKLEKVLNFSSNLETITHSCLYFSMSDSVSRTSFFQQLFVADIADTIAWGTILSFGKLCAI